jgi:5-oxopent-3-ene-1,2,5-tricarboxylate decarboxylase / 2-hydroxyhepta-2,4-diene-1,7-dioate isomerase
MPAENATVVVALMNHAAELAALGAAAHEPPYKAPPARPVLGIKPRNTWAGDGATITVPGEVVIGASLGLVVGRGFVVGCDLSVPVTSHYRPALRQRVRDGFCPLGEVPVPFAGVADPNALGVRVWIDDQLAQRTDTAGRVRSVARLLADISAFMTLADGDVVLLGAAHGSPRAQAGQQVRVEIDGLPPLHFSLRAEAEA